MSRLTILSIISWIVVAFMTGTAIYYLDPEKWRKKFRRKKKHAA